MLIPQESWHYSRIAEKWWKDQNFLYLREKFEEVKHQIPEPQEYQGDLWDRAGKGPCQDVG